MAVLSKVIISALIIGFVTEISKRHPTYGGIIAALPLVSLLSLFWMQIQGEKTAQLSQFASGVLTGIPATVCLLAILAFLLKIHSVTFNNKKAPNSNWMLTILMSFFKFMRMRMVLWNKAVLFHHFKVFVQVIFDVFSSFFRQDTVLYIL